jgi:hypothetical protein
MQTQETAKADYKIEAGGRRSGKQARQNAEFAAEVTRLVRKTAKEQGCGVTVKVMAGWTTAEADPAVERGRIHYVRT